MSMNNNNEGGGGEEIWVNFDKGSENQEEFGLMSFFNVLA